MPVLCLGSYRYTIMAQTAEVRGAAGVGDVGGEVNIPGPVPMGAPGSSILSSSTLQNPGRHLITQSEARSVSGNLRTVL